MIQSTMAATNWSGLLYDDQTRETTEDGREGGFPGKGVEPPVASATSSSSLAELAVPYGAYKVAVFFLVYAKPAVFCVGFAGNTLSLIIMLKPLNRRISCCVYMAVLAVTDNLSLAVTATLTVLWNETSLLFDLPCSFIAFLAQFFMTCGVFIVLAMTVDRFIAVRFPLKSPRLCTVRRARLTSGAVCLASFVYNIPQFIYAKGIGKGAGCVAMGGTSLFATVYSWFSICISCIVPFTTLVIFNILIIRAIRRSKDFMKQDPDGQSATTGSSDARETSQRERQLTVMLMVVSFALLVLTLPQYLRYVVMAIIPNPTTPQGYAYYYLVLHGTSTFFFCNNACNFFLYCIGGSKFRQELVGLFRCKPPAMSQSNSSSVTKLSTVS